MQENTILEKNILVEDSLSDLSIDVMKTCIENGVRCITLLPNATHLLQPLDVVFLRPAKSEWRKILTIWRRETQVKGGFPKTILRLLMLPPFDIITKPENATNESCTERFHVTL